VLKNIDETSSNSFNILSPSNKGNILSPSNKGNILSPSNKGNIEFEPSNNINNNFSERIKIKKHFGSNIGNLNSNINLENSR
jgi:hypothetical protein